MSKQLWVEKYRPSTMDEYVWRDPAMRAKAEEWIEDGSIPHCLFVGVQGTGKTSLCYLLLKALNIPSGDIMYINASRERKVEDIQDRIGNFINTWALGPTGLKYIILDEMDALTPLSQKTLRADLELYSDTTRILATGNYPGKIIPALHSRFHVINFKTLSNDDFIVRAGEILLKENVEFDYDTLDAYVRVSYPDLRKCISLLENNTTANKLNPPLADQEGVQDYMLNIVDMFKAGKYIEGRKLLLSQAQPEEYVSIYRMFYQNLDLFGKSQDQQDDALLIIKKAVVNHPMVADQEINMAATLVELTRNAN